jgi:hypothetical protein
MTKQREDNRIKDDQKDRNERYKRRIRRDESYYPYKQPPKVK